MIAKILIRNHIAFDSLMQFIMYISGCLYNITGPQGFPKWAKFDIPTGKIINMGAIYLGFSSLNLQN